MTVAALEYLERGGEAPGVCVAFGDETFLKRRVLIRLRDEVLGPDGDGNATTLSGAEAVWRDIHDELSTRSLFGGGRRMVIIDDADTFVTKNRKTLEDYAGQPSSAGVLALSVSTWPSNTKLYKLVEASCLAIDCKTPATAALQKWLSGWAKTAHGAKLPREAAEELLELVGPELGLLDQELAKLAVSVGSDEAITVEAVREFVGGWRAKTTWEMLDSALAGNAPRALEELDRLLLGGENPIGLLAQIGFTLRRFAAAARYIEQAERQGKRSTLPNALVATGTKPVPFILNKAEDQLRRLGRQRAGQLYRLLLRADLALKGESSAGPRARLVLEQMIARLASAPTQPAAAR